MEVNNELGVKKFTHKLTAVESAVICSALRLFDTKVTESVIYSLKQYAPNAICRTPDQLIDMFHNDIKEQEAKNGI